MSTQDKRITRSRRRKTEKIENVDEVPQPQSQLQDVSTDNSQPLQHEYSSILTKFGDSCKMVLQHFSSVLIIIGSAWPKWSIRQRDSEQAVFSYSLSDVTKLTPPRGSASSTVIIPKNLKLHQKSLQVEALSWRLHMENARLGTLILLSHCETKFYNSPNIKTITPVNCCAHISTSSTIIINGAQVNSGRAILALETLVRDLSFTHVMINFVDCQMLRGVEKQRLMNQVKLITKLMKITTLEQARNRFVLKYGTAPEDIRFISNEQRYTNGFTWSYSVFNLREPPSTPFMCREMSLECPRCSVEQCVEKLKNVVPDPIPDDNMDALVFLVKKIRNNSPLGLIETIPEPVFPSSGLDGEDSVFTQQTTTNLSLFVDDRDTKATSKRPLTEGREASQSSAFGQAIPPAPPVSSIPSVPTVPGPQQHVFDPNFVSSPAYGLYYTPPTHQYECGPASGYGPTPIMSTYPPSVVPQDYSYPPPLMSQNVSPP